MGLTCLSGVQGGRSFGSAIVLLLEGGIQGLDPQILVQGREMGEKQRSLSCTPASLYVSGGEMINTLSPVSSSVDVWFHPDSSVTKDSAERTRCLPSAPPVVHFLFPLAEAWLPLP